MLFRTAGMLIAFVIGTASVVPASAQAPYPNRPIRIVVPFGPGGFADITVRLLAQKLTERTNAQVVIENRPGAGGITAASTVTSAQPDGYTLFVFSSGIALSKSLLKSMPFDPVTAFAPISTMALFDLLLLVKSDSPMHSLKDALDAARADPQKFNVGTISPGSTQNVTGELLRSTTGIPMTVVPHRTSAEVLTSLLRGDTQIGIEFLRRAQVGDRQQADPRRRLVRQPALAAAAGRTDTARERHRRGGGRLELAGGADRYAARRRRLP